MRAFVLGLLLLELQLELSEGAQLAENAVVDVLLGQGKLLVVAEIHVDEKLVAVPELTPEKRDKPEQVPNARAEEEQLQVAEGDAPVVAVRVLLVDAA